MTVSDLIEKSVQYYFKKSDIAKKTMKKVLNYQKYAEGIERGKRRNKLSVHSGTIEYEHQDWEGVIVNVKKIK